MQTSTATAIVQMSLWSGKAVTSRRSMTTSAAVLVAGGPMVKPAEVWSPSITPPEVIAYLAEAIAVSNASPSSAGKAIPLRCR